MLPKSSHWRMADRLADGQLEEVLLTYRDAGMSADAIAARLFARYGIETTGTTVTNWLTSLMTPPPTQEMTG